MALRTQEFIGGVRDTLPLMLGAFPFGLIYGAVAATSGLSPTAAMAMSAFVFAGASQFIALGLVATQTPVAIIVLTTLVVILRHLLYSAVEPPECQLRMRPSAFERSRLDEPRQLREIQAALEPRGAASQFDRA